MGVLEVDLVLRVLPVDRRFTLYNGWKGTWLRQHARLARLKASALDNTAMASTVSELSSATQVSILYT